MYWRPVYKDHPNMNTSHPMYFRNTFVITILPPPQQAFHHCGWPHSQPEVASLGHLVTVDNTEILMKAIAKYWQKSKSLESLLSNELYRRMIKWLAQDFETFIMCLPRKDQEFRGNGEIRISVHYQRESKIVTRQWKPTRWGHVNTKLLHKTEGGLCDRVVAWHVEDRDRQTDKQT